jgi:hypothetical protein
MGEAVELFALPYWRMALLNSITAFAYSISLLHNFLSAHAAPSGGICARNIFTDLFLSLNN